MISCRIFLWNSPAKNQKNISEQKIFPYRVPVVGTALSAEAGGRGPALGPALPPGPTQGGAGGERDGHPLQHQHLRERGERISSHNWWTRPLNGRIH